METLPRDQLVEIELERFRQTLSYAKTHSAFYQERYADIDPKEVRSIGDVRKLPLVDKEDLRRAQDDKEHFLFGEMLGVSPEQVPTFRQTSGTTGKPVYVPESRFIKWLHKLGLDVLDKLLLQFHADQPAVEIHRFYCRCARAEEPVDDDIVLFGVAFEDLGRDLRYEVAVII